MKLYYLANVRMPTEKAHGVQIMNMCQAFAVLGHDVTLVIPRFKNPIHEDSFEYYGISPSFHIVRVTSLSALRLWGRIGFFLQTLSFALIAASSVRKGRPDYIYSRDPEVIAFCSLFQKGAYIWEAHTARMNMFVQRACSVAKAVIAISGGLLDFYVTRGLQKKKSIVFHDAVDVQKFAVSEDKKTTRRRLSLPEERDIIEYVGKFQTMGEAKGVEEIIAIAADLAKVNSNIFLLLGGLNSGEIPLAEEAARQSGLAKINYQFVGHVAHAIVPLYLHAADVLLMNYPNVPHYANIMSPLKVFEYMASGVPIVTTDLPSLREVLSDATAYFVPVENRHAYQDAVQKALRDKERSQEKAKKARETVQTSYSWEHRAHAILSFVASHTS